MRTQKTLVVVADAASARFYEASGIGRDMVELTELAHSQSIPPGRELERDRSPRTHDSSGPARHGTEPADSPRRNLKRAFAEAVANTIDTAAAGKRFDRIAIAAPPAMLGDLRSAMRPETRAIVAAELDKDLVHVPARDLRQHFRDLLVF
ncbi:MAG TPA: host attachment protein [Hyphomicrobiaceae bacterium]|nr:host attachment protein [Hyphomicrobiaceae bacterium]